VTIALHWFRTDLRVADNPGLAAAQASGLPVAGLYIATPAQWDMHDDAPIKRDFWRRNLHELQQSLMAMGIPLLTLQVPRYGDIPALLERLLPLLQVEPPALIKGYLKCGAKVLGAPAWDPDFGTADLPMMLQLREMSPAYRRRLLGA
jgi:hypothetical protein